SWLTDHIAVNLQGSVVTDPDDDQQFRADGSYIGVNVGNFMISAGFMERWWGPGWDGNLILSTNARPIPSITVERNYTDPFKSKLLSWLGTWRASIAMGEMESEDVAVPNVLFYAARINFKPRPWFEFGLTRTAQWCGGERPCDWETFSDMLLGRDNQVEGGESSEDQPGNQMAGYDLRVRSPWKALPLAVYGQMIGEDEAGSLPSKFIGLFGIETWGSSSFGGWRLRAEYAGTACNFAREAPEYNCAYRNSIYPQGYSYRGRTIGHAMDNDSVIFSLAGILTRPGGDTFSLTVRRVELNRDGGPHPISEVPLDLDNVELRYSRMFGAGKVVFGVGYDGRSPDPATGSDVRGYVTWQQGI
ncbi:MAG TPA: capsule assembly Wzi family protein, partial [Steroidobacteraceae bacterium]|nr:capsule assembly Wzi family protein [Steroidobacteraceae bacterium]